MTSFESYQLKARAGLDPEQHLKDTDKFIVQARDHLNSLLAQQALLRQVLDIQTIGQPPEVIQVEVPQATALISVVSAA